VAGIVAGHYAFPFLLVKRREWPGVLYASVEPELPFRSLHEELDAAFPMSRYQGELPFVPHVTIAFGPAGVTPEAAADAAWECLPTALLADSVDLIVRGAGGWTVRWRVGLRSERQRDGSLRGATNR
jgi:2'-5' RNA ligase